MKPLVLTMEAFGSYGQKTTIDFNDLNQNLFLITGDTGAGKSTIFDAIVFALYGEASSNNNKKDGRELQSQYTNYETEPYVALSFSELSADGEKIYTVRRVPRHFMQMKRKDGVKEVSEKVSLTMPDGTVYPEKESDKKIEEIVGLTKTQFMQIAMIAQGEFMELLRAKSDDKKVIFRKLFHTEMYQDIVNEFANRKKSVEKEIGIIRTVCQNETTHIMIPEQYERHDELQALKTKITASERLSIVDLEALMEELTLLKDHLTERYNQVKAELEGAEQKKNEDNDTYIKAESLNKLFLQLDEANDTLRLCSEQEQEMQEKRVLVQQILAAYEIQPKYGVYQEKIQNVNQLTNHLNEQLTKYPELQTRLLNASEKENNARTVHEREMAEFALVEKKVSAARSLFQNIKNAEMDIMKHNTANSNKDAQIRQQEEAFKKLETDITGWKQQEESLKAVEHAIELLNRKKAECNSAYREVRELESMQKSINELETAIKKAVEDYKIVERQYDAGNMEYEQYRKAFFNAQAGIIAREELKEGLPCPVCGAIDHPNPCKLENEDKNLTREGLDQLAQTVDELRKQQEVQAGEIQTMKTSVNEKKQNVESSLVKLAEKLHENIPDVPTQITIPQANESVTRWITSIKEEDAKLQQDNTALVQVRELLAGCDEKLQDMKISIEKCKDEKNSIVIALETRKADLSNYRKQLEYDTEADANSAYNSAKTRKDEAEIAFHQARKAASDAKTEFENSKVLIETYQKELPLASEELKVKQAEYETALNEHAMDAPTWQAVVSSYTKGHCADLQDTLKLFEQKKMQAEAVKVSVENTVSGQTRPDLAVLENNKNASEERYKLARDAFDIVKDAHRINHAVYDALAPKMEERKELVDQHARIDRLYRLLSGNVSGSRMDIETYAQRYYMEKILYAANKRFQEMSAGQFELRMYDLEKAGEGKNRGLDLIVYSNVTGKEREVRTLSGGESFMAALSLALGMADQIQEKSSAINLDMMFIDEGFGSLDDYSREQAVKVLREMANGSKLIGIISHVTELKQQIDNQLIVRKDEQGSHVRWQIS